MELQRLDKIIASTGRWSRREAKELVRRGLVTVDGAAAGSVEEKFDPEEAEIAVNGEAIGYRRYTWIMLNKPAGVLSATEDGRGKTVLDLLPREGLMLLTNEGVLAHALLSPKRHVDKVYYARAAGRLTEEDCLAFAAGLSLEDGLRCLPAKLEILSAGEESEARVTLREGKFHQVKRMLAARGKPVVYLERIQMGTLPLDRGLSRGAFRFLTEEEVAELRALV